MAITTMSEATAQLNDNLDWETRPAAIPLALEAARWLFFNRPISSALGTSKLDYEALGATISTLSGLARTTTAGTSNRCSFTSARGRRS
jgi:hypothetical protein